MKSPSTVNKRIYKIVVDRDACISAGPCVVEAPDAFRLDEEGIAVVIDGSAQIVDDEKLFLAAQSCPTQAIILFDKNGNKIFPVY